MSTRHITGTIHHPSADGPWVGASVTFRYVTRFVSGALVVYPTDVVTATTDSAGAFDATVATPDDGAGTALVLCGLPDGSSFYFNLAYGTTAITLADLVATATAIGDGTWDSIATLIAAHAAIKASTTVLGHVTVDGTTITAADGVITSVGGGGGGAPSGPAGGVLGGTYPNPSFAADMATQAELDSEASTRAAADTTLQTNITNEATARATADALRLLIASNLSDLANVGTARTNLGLGGLAVLSAITASLISDASANGQSLITAADYAAMRTLLGAAPLTPTYITTTVNSELSGEIAIPGLAASPDIKSAAGAGTSREFESGDTAPTFTSAPAVTDVGVTVASHLYISTTDTTERFAYYAWSAAGAFDVRCKVSPALLGTTGGPDISLMVANTGRTERVLTLITYGLTALSVAKAFTYTASTFTQRGANITSVPNNTYVYLRITRDGSNNVSFYVSVNGIAWQLIATQSFTFTVGEIGWRLSNPAATDWRIYIDWLRTDV